MIGMMLSHEPTGLVGTVNAEKVTSDGRALVRLEDRCFLAGEFA